MKLFSGLITILFALLISATAAWFSVAGLVALFAATAIPVMIMGTVLETSKLVAAGWLHSNWKNPNVNLLHKTYLTAAVLALMLITSIGIYGFLSKGHLEQAAPLAGVELQVNAKQQQIQMLQDNNARLVTQLKQLDSSVDLLISSGKATAGLRARKTQGAERADIQKQMTGNNDQITKLSADILPLKTQSAEVEAKLGPVKYVAQLFGWTDTDKAVRLVILVIMFAFDPLAVILLISATISFAEYAEEKQNKKRRVTDLKLEDEDDMRVVPASMAYAPGFKGNELGIPVPIKEEPVPPVVDAREPDDMIEPVWRSEPVTPVANAAEEQKELRSQLEDMNGRIEPTFGIPEQVVDEQEPVFVPEVEKANDEDKLAAMRETDPMAPPVTINDASVAIVAEEAHQGDGEAVSAPGTQQVTNDKERLIEILESRPAFLQELIDVIGDHIKQADPEDKEEPKFDVKSIDAPKGPNSWLK